MLLVGAPKLFGIRDIPLLPLLGSACQQDHQHLTIASEIDPVSRTKIDSVFEHACSNGFHVREISLLDPRQRNRDLGARNGIQMRKPITEGTSSVPGDEVADFEHEDG